MHSVSAHTSKTQGDSAGREPPHSTSGEGIHSHRLERTKNTAVSNPYTDSSTKRTSSKNSSQYKSYAVETEEPASLQTEATHRHLGDTIHKHATASNQPSLQDRFSQGDHAKVSLGMQQETTQEKWWNQQQVAYTT